MRDLRYVAVCFSLAAFAAGLAGCAPTPGSSPTVGGRGTTGAGTTPTANDTGATAGAGASPTKAGKASSAGSFVLAEGTQHHVCGIAVRVKFVPPSASGGNQYQAFLVAGPIGSGDQPQPGAVAPANPGSIATVLGQRFRVIAVDARYAKVTLEALC